MGAPPSDAGLWTLANLVSLVRIAAVPVFLWLLLAQDDVEAAAILFLVIGATDWVDGRIARRMGQVSEVGKVLDPLADRLAIVAAVIGGWIAGILPAWFTGLLLVREAVGLVVGLTLWRKTRKFLVVRRMGKVATFIVYGAIPALYLAAVGVAPEFLRPAGLTAAAVGLVFYWWVGYRYFLDFRTLMNEEAASA